VRHISDDCRKGFDATTRGATSSSLHHGEARNARLRLTHTLVAVDTWDESCTCLVHRSNKDRLLPWEAEEDNIAPNILSDCHSSEVCVLQPFFRNCYFPNDITPSLAPRSSLLHGSPRILLKFMKLE
jgi:hypothetical protein